MYKDGELARNWRKAFKRGSKREKKNNGKAVRFYCRKCVFMELKWREKSGKLES